MQSRLRKSKLTVREHLKRRLSREATGPRTAGSGSRYLAPSADADLVRPAALGVTAASQTAWARNVPAARCIVRRAERRGACPAALMAGRAGVVAATHSSGGIAERSYVRPRATNHTRGARIVAATRAAGDATESLSARSRATRLARSAGGVGAT